MRMQTRFASRFFTISLALGLPGLLLCNGNVFAQRGTSAPKTDTGKNKIKVLSSYGPWSNSAKAFVADFKRLLTTNPQIVLKDDKGLMYKVTSFEITWKKKDISDDFKTGKPKTVYYFVGGTIQDSSMPDSWKEEMTNFLQAGEEITLGNILYFDTRRKSNYKAPPIVIAIM